MELSSCDDSLDSLELTFGRPRMTELGGGEIGMAGRALSTACCPLDWWSVSRAVSF